MHGCAMVVRLDSRFRGNDEVGYGNDEVGCGNDEVSCGNDDNSTPSFRKVRSTYPESRSMIRYRIKSGMTNTVEVDAGSSPA